MNIVSPTSLAATLDSAAEALFLSKTHSNRLIAQDSCRDAHQPPDSIWIKFRVLHPLHR